MNLTQVRPVIEAVLYEGYILYPYRPTATKNRQRWTFGGIYPQNYFEASGGADPYHMQTQCLVEGNSATHLELRLGFLHPLAREVGELEQPIWPQHGEPAFRRVASLIIDEQVFYSWQEAMERQLTVADTSLGELLEQSLSLPFAFPGRRELAPLKDRQGTIRGVLLHSQQAVQGELQVKLIAVDKGLYRLSLRVENHTPMGSYSDREEASLYSFASSHCILGVGGGAFISLQDPPPGLGEAAAACQQEGAYPVLVGQPGSRDTLLCSPIILYDYPEIAPESPGDLYDATEIDEILSLRILAMTDAEKREMVATDPRAAALLARTEALDGEDFMRLHGTLRDDPDNDPHQPLQVGDRVRLRPRAGGDIMDVVLDGKIAIIESIERDFDNRVHVAVTIEDDPGREWGIARMPGHRFFFSPAELEALEPP